MSLIKVIYTPQETVNDQFLSVVKVHIANGVFVNKGDQIAELETSKALMDIIAEDTGYVKVYIKEGEDVMVGSKLFEFFDNLEDLLLNQPEDTLPNPDQQPSIEIKNDLLVNKIQYFSDAAKKFIEEKGISKDIYKDLEFITTKDLIFKTNISKIEIPLNSEPKIKVINPVETEIIKLTSNKRREIEFLTQSNSIINSRLNTEIIIGEISILGKVQNFIKATPLPIIIFEISRLLVKYPNLNSYYFEDHQAIYKGINIGFAIDNGINGLKVASVINTNELNLLEIEEAITELSLKYEENKLDIDELTSATFTITDLFNTQVKSFNPLLNTGNSAICGISSLQDGAFQLDLSFDHRITSGKEVANFLSDLKARLEYHFKSNKVNNAQSKDIHCLKCFRQLDEDMDGEIYFVTASSSIENGVLCINCLRGW